MPRKTPPCLSRRLPWKPLRALARKIGAQPDYKDLRKPRERIEKVIGTAPEIPIRRGRSLGRYRAGGRSVRSTPPNKRRGASCSIFVRRPPAHNRMQNGWPATEENFDQVDVEGRIQAGRAEVVSFGR